MTALSPGLSPFLNRFVDRCTRSRRCRTESGLSSRVNSGDRKFEIRLTFNADTPLIEVDVSPAQTADLAATGAGGGRHVEPARHAWVVSGGLRDEHPHVRRRRRTDGRPRHGRARRVGGGVARQPTPSHGLRHSAVQHDVCTTTHCEWARVVGASDAVAMNCASSTATVAVDPPCRSQPSRRSGVAARRGHRPWFP